MKQDAGELMFSPIVAATIVPCGNRGKPPQFRKTLVPCALSSRRRRTLASGAILTGKKNGSGAFSEIEKMNLPCYFPCELRDRLRGRKAH
jgi:hypothetical protein